MNEELIIDLKDGVRTIIFNTPKKKNAVSRDMYRAITNILNADAKDDSIIVTIFTGHGEYFTSGNDMSGGLTAGNDDIEVRMREGWQTFKNFAEALIAYPKLLIAVVNGPAVGVGVTMLALCDVVYASDLSTFYTPFVHLALCCEATSSYILPRILGRSKASELLLLGERISAKEAYDFNLISKIIPHERIPEFTRSLHKYGKLSVNSIILNKKLMKEAMIDSLVVANSRECEALWEAQNSEEFMTNVLNFLSRKKNSKL